MTPIENNLPFKLLLPQDSVDKLIIENEFVFGNLSQQTKDTVSELIEGSLPDSCIFEDQDLIISQHSEI